jgi:hypothetical protein
MSIGLTKGGTVSLTKPASAGIARDFGVNVG